MWVDFILLDKKEEFFFYCTDIILDEFKEFPAVETVFNIGDIMRRIVNVRERIRA